MDEKKVYKKNKNIVSRVIAGETILLPVYRTSEEINCIYTLNEAASWVWNRINGKLSLSEIKQEILNNFATTSAQAEKHLEGLLKDLAKIKAIL